MTEKLSTGIYIYMYISFTTMEATEKSKNPLAIFLSKAFSSNELLNYIYGR